MFYHDHAWGITRLNVYAGEAAGYLITDPTEQKLIANGTHPGRPDPADHPGPHLCAQRRPAHGDTATRRQDPTWDNARWGGEGNLWYHHVYMPAQNPGDPSGMSAYGRWMYGPWFWPPATPQVRPDRQSRTTTRTATWTIRPPGSTRPIPSASPQLIPGTPEHLGRHGAVQRHACRQRHRLPDDQCRSEVLPPAHPECGQ